MFNEVSYLDDLTRAQVEAEAAAAKARLDAAVANWRELQRQMFNETSSDQPIHLFSNPCPAGQVQDYDPETRSFLPGCVMDTAAYQAGGYPTGGAAGAAKPTDWSSYLMYGGIALVALMVLTGGRRR